ncbi:MAG: hypothetical protein WBB70_06320, partial [Desulfobacterales bacterium]
ADHRANRFFDRHIYGVEVPNATTVTPITSSETLNRRTMDDETSIRKKEGNIPDWSGTSFTLRIPRHFNQKLL